MSEITVPIVRTADAADLPYPAYATAGASGADLYAAVREARVIVQGEIVLVPTGIALAVPGGYEAQVRARSGLAARHAVALVNAPGTIDSDYRGEISVILTVLGREPFTLVRGTRVAQLVFAPVVRARFRPVERLDETPRGSGGFGHTGTR